MALKATDLRVGNIVNEVLEPGKFAKVSHIHSDGILTELGCAWAFDELNPIPLTEEWLLKFGFEKKDTSLFRKADKFFELFRINNEYYRAYFKNASIIADTEYVHQLQNLYYCLCGQELTA